MNNQAVETLQSKIKSEIKSSRDAAALNYPAVSPQKLAKEETEAVKLEDRSKNAILYGVEEEKALTKKLWKLPGPLINHYFVK